MSNVMHKILVAFLASLVPMGALAAGGSSANLDPIEIKLSDERALQAGAGLFVNYCLSCHSAEYMRYNRLVSDLNLPEDLVKANMIFTDAKIGDPMTTTMTKDDGEVWFGVSPPDLTLIGRLRGPEWLYSYLRAFYVDDNTVSGWNNLVFPNVAMPHVMHGMQGIRKAVFKTEADASGNQQPVFERYEEISPGSMTEEEFDRAMSDLTHFLVYMGEPSKLVSTKYGLAVLAFLGVFGFSAWLLKKEYWRDVH
ncbi:MAG: cytochrome c1 [Pseudomonadota bacterium]